jgi:hypothetical protein
MQLSTIAFVIGASRIEAMPLATRQLRVARDDTLDYVDDWGARLVDYPHEYDNQGERTDT